MIALWIFFSQLTFAEGVLYPIRTESPRDTFRTFYEAMNDYRKGKKTQKPALTRRINDAIQTLDLSEFPVFIREEKGKEAAIFLKELIDRIILIDFKKIPDETQMKQSDQKRWRLKDSEIIIHEITQGTRQSEYLFSSKTVKRAKTFYKRVKHLPYLKGSGQGAVYQAPWFFQELPEWSLDSAFGLPYWKWIALLVILITSFLLKILLPKLVSRILFSSKWKKWANWNSIAEIKIDTPLGWMGASLFALVSFHFLDLDGRLLFTLTSFAQLTLSYGLILLTYRFTDLMVNRLQRLAHHAEFPLDDHLMPLIRKLAKASVIILGTLIAIQNLGFNVLSLLAGLGLGGLAFALAAKDTCANLFGSIMIFMDQPFRIGDWIQVEGIDGTVEDIGFRSTRLRTFHNSVVSIPNALMANVSIDNMGARNHRRIKTVLGIHYDTPPEKIESFVEGIKNIILANPQAVHDNFHVVFQGYGNSALEILVYCFLDVENWSRELVVKQNLFLEIYRLAETLKIEFAYPTQTLFIHQASESKEPCFGRQNPEIFRKKFWP